MLCLWDQNPWRKIRIFYASCALRMWHICIATHFHPLSAISVYFYPVLLHVVLCCRWMLDYDDGDSPDFVYIHKHKWTKKCGRLQTPKRIPTFMAIALPSLGNNVFVDSFYELL